MWHREWKATPAIGNFEQPVGHFEGRVVSLEKMWHSAIRRSAVPSMSAEAALLLPMSIPTHTASSGAQQSPRGGSPCPRRQEPGRSPLPPAVVELEHLAYEDALALLAQSGSAELCGDEELRWPLAHP